MPSTCVTRFVGVKFDEEFCLYLKKNVNFILWGVQIRSSGAIVQPGFLSNQTDNVREGDFYLVGRKTSLDSAPGDRIWTPLYD